MPGIPKLEVIQAFLNERIVGREVVRANEGLVYYVRPNQLPQVPRREEQGPDVYDSGLFLDGLTVGLKPLNGEIKSILTVGNL
jgi:hypothetical protein